ncbi:MAG: SIMPL domain-containing protein [Hyphomicrobiaceae bacterium]
MWPLAIVEGQAKGRAQFPRRSRGSARALAAVTAMWLAAGALLPAALAQEKRPMERVITVSASGTVAAEPDLALISTGVLSEAATARDALTQNTAAMKKIIDGLKGAGIEPKDIQTVHFGIQPRYVHSKDGQPPRITGYQVINNLRITVREVARLGEVMDGVVTLGANQAGGIAFEVSKAETLKDEARRVAMANALRRAKLFADAAGAKVGPVISISEEVQGGGPRPMVQTRAAMSADSVPVEAGSKTLEVRVQVTWALE